VEASVATVQLSKETVRASWGAAALCKRSACLPATELGATKPNSHLNDAPPLPQGPVIYLRVTTGDGLRGLLLPVFVGTQEVSRVCVRLRS
jgi:hypothetical protein